MAGTLRWTWHWPRTARRSPFAIGAKRIAPVWKALAGISESDWTDAIDMPGAHVAVATYCPPLVAEQPPAVDPPGGTGSRADQHRPVVEAVDVLELPQRLRGLLPFPEVGQVPLAATPPVRWLLFTATGSGAVSGELALARVRLHTAGAWVALRPPTTVGFLSPQRLLWMAPCALPDGRLGCRWDRPRRSVSPVTDSARDADGE